MKEHPGESDRSFDPAGARDQEELEIEEPRWELQRIFRSALGRLRWGLRLLLVGAAILVLAQVASVYRMLADIHPWAGLAGALVFLALVAWFLVRPLARMIELPVAISPPRMPAAAERTTEHARRQLAYVEQYLNALRSNPEMEEHRTRIDTELALLRELRRDAERIDDTRELSARVVHFERNVVLPLLEPLDRRAEVLIHRESLAIATMTALSLNGTVDAFLVLWRNVNLVAALARLYYGRPGLAGTWLILRDVASAILLSSVLERITDMGSSALHKVMGESGRSLPLVGAVAGPMFDGTVNGLMTMKVGYLAQERCRSFRAWDGRTKRGILRRTFHLVADSAGLLMEELQKTVGRSLNLVKVTADAGKGAAQSVGSKTVELLRSLRRAVTPPPSPDENP